MTEFWLKHPQVLFKKENIHKLWPYDCMTFNEKLNATTRFIILITLVGYSILGNYTIMLFGAILILSMVVVHRIHTKGLKEEVTENFEGREIDQDIIDSNNPMSNVLINEIVDNPEREAAPEYSEVVEENINLQTKNFILENNKDNKDIGNIFNNLGDNLEFEKSMRQFYINPSTTIPNGQKEFTDFCYGDLYSEKPFKQY